MNQLSIKSSCVCLSSFYSIIFLNNYYYYDWNEFSGLGHAYIKLRATDKQCKDISSVKEFPHLRVIDLQGNKVLFFSIMSSFPLSTYSFRHPRKKKLLNVCQTLLLKKTKGRKKKKLNTTFQICFRRSRTCLRLAS
jgi:hypothetical protein